MFGGGADGEADRAEGGKDFEQVAEKFSMSFMVDVGCLHN